MWCYGTVLRTLCAALKRVTRAERVYVLVTIEGVPHFHAWLIPRRSDDTERGWAFVTAAHSCTTAEAEDVVAHLRRLLPQ